MMKPSTPEPVDNDSVAPEAMPALDILANWVEVLPLLLRIHEHGNATAREDAFRQLHLMAMVADIGNRAFAALARQAGTELDPGGEAAQVLLDVSALQPPPPTGQAD